MCTRSKAIDEYWAGQFGSDDLVPENKSVHVRRDVWKEAMHNVLDIVWSCQGRGEVFTTCSSQPADRAIRNCAIIADRATKHCPSPIRLDRKTRDFELCLSTAESDESSRKLSIPTRKSWKTRAGSWSSEQWPGLPPEFLNSRSLHQSQPSDNGRKSSIPAGSTRMRISSRSLHIASAAMYRLPGASQYLPPLTFYQWSSASGLIARLSRPTIASALLLYKLCGAHVGLQCPCAALHIAWPGATTSCLYLVVC